MAKKDRKKSFFKRSVEVAEDSFKGIFKEIISNAKSNSDVDMKILEPDLKEAITQIADELKKDKKNAKMKLEEVKGIASNAFSAVKEAIKSDTKNGLDDNVKKEWYDELDDFDLDSFIDDIDFDEDELEDDEEGSMESENEDDYQDILDNNLSPEKIKVCTDILVLLLCSIELPEFKKFFYEKKEELLDLLKYKVCNEKEVPVTISPSDKEEIGNELTRSMELVHQYISMEDGVEPDEEEPDRTFEENLDNMGEPEFIESDTKDDRLLDEDVIKEYEDLINKGKEDERLLLTVRERMSSDDKLVVDTVISMLMIVYDLFKKDSNNEENDIEDNVTFLEFFINNCKIIDIDFIRNELECNNMKKLELIITIIGNIPVL